MFVFNFAHPLLPEHIAQLEGIIEKKVEKIIKIEVHIDTEKPLAPQVVALADKINLNETQWETLPILINPPSLNYIAVALTAELHGRMGYFPPMIRLRPVREHAITRYRIAEVADLQTMRNMARRKRK